MLFARACVNAARLLLLDEPFAGVDCPTRHALLRRADALAANGTAVVLTTHQRDDWPGCATHELELAGGRARYCGPLRTARCARRAQGPRVRDEAARRVAGGGARRRAPGAGALAVFMGSPLFWERYLWPAHTQARGACPPGTSRASASPAPTSRRRHGWRRSSNPLESQALAAAAAYAAAHGSLALIVARHDHIVFERYWQGSGFDTLTDAESLTRLLAALATGSAISHRLIGWPDEPIGYIVRELAHDRRGAITLRNLMQLSSGLAPAAAGRRPWGAAARALFGTDIVAAALARPLHGRAGESGRRRVPTRSCCRLRSSAPPASVMRATCRRRCGGASARATPGSTSTLPPGRAHADCCMLARQGDWIRVAELLLRRRQLPRLRDHPPGLGRSMRMPARANHDYGAYLRLSAAAAGARGPYVAPDTYAVDNDGGNRLWLIPSLHIAVLCTADGPRGADFDDARIPNLIVARRTRLRAAGRAARRALEDRSRPLN